MSARTARTSRGAALAVAVGAWACHEGVADAQVTAHLRLDGIDGGCLVTGPEPFPLGDPDRYWRMAIFDLPNATIFGACANGCAGDGNPATADGRTLDGCVIHTGCGIMPITGSGQVDKVIPNGSGAYFYVGLWDEDSDPDDSLGDHWFFASGSRTLVELNSNISPYDANSYIGTVCGWDVEGIGAAANFQLETAVTFTDATGPSAPGAVGHVDDGLTTYWDNDQVIDLQWTNGSDPNSGISAHVSSFWWNGGYIWQNLAAPSSGSLTICPSGCTHAYTVAHGQEYQFLIGARNGGYPTLTNTATSYASWIQLGVDLVSPTTAITSPGSGTWQRADFGVGFADSDSGSGLSTCEWRVISSGVQTLPFTAHACNTGTTATVGPGGLCRHQGANVCSVSARSTDAARRVSSTATRQFSIDWTPDSVLSVTGWTSVGGTEILAGSWTSDNTPAARATFSSSAAPYAGHSWAVDATPDCAADTPGSNPLDIQLSVLSDGVHVFGVRPIDAAGNCGSVGTFTFRVDTQPDAVTTIQATGPGGTPPILDGVWQGRNDVEMSWAASSSMAPISGYSHALGSVPDCATDTSGLTVSLTDVPEGMTPFAVRAIDDAGNCGIPSTFNLAVDTVADPILGVAAFSASGGSPILPSVWQGDNDPFLDWADTVSTSPIAGYSVAIDAAPPCVAAVAVSEYQLPADSIPDGVHTIQLRAIDDAGNCGPTTTFEIWVNSVQGQNPGRILNGLRLSKGAGSDVDLTWTGSCDPIGTDYTVHEGVLGTWFSHQAIECTTFGSTAATVTPGADARYYLVVPVSLGEEGSYGSGSGGTERPPSSVACLPQAPPAPCP